MARRKKNREQRRRAEFGGHGPTGFADLAPTTTSPAEDPAETEIPEQVRTSRTGSGAGGATEAPGRIVRTEGTHATNAAKG